MGRVGSWEAAPSEGGQEGRCPLGEQVSSMTGQPQQCPAGLHIPGKRSVTGGRDQLPLGIPTMSGSKRQQVLETVLTRSS